MGAPFCFNSFDLGIFCPMASKESIEHKRQKEKDKRKREEQEAQDILKSGRFVITEEREQLVADLVNFVGQWGLKDQILLV